MSDSGPGGADHSGRDHSQRGPAPGWYPDPSGVHRSRWWDGYAWTNQVQDVAANQEVLPPSVSGPARANRIVLVAGIAAAVVVGTAALALVGGSGEGPSAGTCIDFDTVVSSPAETYLSSLDAGSLREVNCSESHYAEVLHTISASQAQQEGIGSLREAERFCEQEYFESFVGIPYAQSALSIEPGWLGPDEEVFDGPEAVVCLLFEDLTPRTGSMRGSGR